jgi:hypothetical protein
LQKFNDKLDLSPVAGNEICLEANKSNEDLFKHFLAKRAGLNSHRSEQITAAERIAEHKKLYAVIAKFLGGFGNILPETITQKVSHTV